MVSRQPRRDLSHKRRHARTKESAAHPKDVDIVVAAPPLPLPSLLEDNDNDAFSARDFQPSGFAKAAVLKERKERKKKKVIVCRSFNVAPGEPSAFAA